MSRYTISPLARQDIQSIWDYIALENQSPDAADSLVDRFFARFRLLASRPLLGELRRDLRPGLRSFTVGRYVLLYYPTASGVEIAGVVHGARDIEGMFRRGER